MKRLFQMACATCLFLPQWCFAELSPWQLEAHDEDKDILVYTREIENSELKEFKGVTRVKADISALVALLKDDQAATSWMHNVIQFDVKEQISDVENIVYTVNEAPWPVTNRDVYIHSLMVANANGVVTSLIKAESGFGELNDDYVRMPSIEGAWTFTPLAEGGVEVVYQVHADPGGSLPDWLVNSIVVETPLETLSNLQRKVKEDKYQNQSFAFIENAKLQSADVLQ